MFVVKVRRGGGTETIQFFQCLNGHILNEINLLTIQVINTLIIYCIDKAFVISINL